MAGACHKLLARWRAQAWNRVITYSNCRYLPTVATSSIPYVDLTERDFRNLRNDTQQ
jgi:hypothetical protein